MTLQFGRDVPRCAQQAVRAALELVDEKGEVVGGMSGLQTALGHDSPAVTRRAVSLAEQHGLMRRVGPIGHGQRRVFVVEARLNVGGCSTPGCDRPPRGRWCVTCRQVHRADREWGHRAVEMAVAGVTPNVIAVTVSRPLFPDVVFHLLSEVPALVSDDWRSAFAEQCPEHVRQISDRLRQRRNRESRRQDARMSP
jgi:hypothetical protein